MFNKKQIIFIVIFAVLAVISDNIPIAQVAGAQYPFTLFQLLGPVAGGFLGPILGAITVLVANVFNFITQGRELTLLNLLRLLPMVAAAFYFGKLKDNPKFEKLKVVLPLICIGLFILHPIGRSAWFYSLFWTIPIIVRLKWLSKYTFAKSLGATFTAHAVGGAAFVYTVGLSKEIWLGLIPVTATERLIFALGITASYFAINTVLDVVSKWVEIDSAVEINKNASALRLM